MRGLWRTGQSLDSHSYQHQETMTTSPGARPLLSTNGFFIREQENPRYLTLIIRLESKSIILSKKIKFKNINQNLNLDAKMKL